MSARNRKLKTMKTKMTLTNDCIQSIPKGNGREDIKVRKQLINSFYASWNAKNPGKKVWNKSLQAYIHVKYRANGHFG